MTGLSALSWIPLDVQVLHVCGMTPQTKKVPGVVVALEDFTRNSHISTNVSLCSKVHFMISYFVLALCLFWFVGITLTFITLTILMSTGQEFCRMFLNLDSSHVFLWLDWNNGLWDIQGEMPCSPCPPGGHVSVYQPDQLAKIQSARLLQPND